MFLYQQRVTAEHRSGPVSSYDGSSYHADDYPEQYHTEVPPSWVNDTASPHWQQPRCVMLFLPKHMQLVSVG